jgi:hypothetical protein
VLLKFTNFCRESAVPKKPDFPFGNTPIGTRKRNWTFQVPLTVRGAVTPFWQELSDRYSHLLVNGDYDGVSL